MSKVHFIGICGVAMSAIAIAFHKKGWQVTGSDVGFFPPISTYLKNNNIEFYPGWHVEKMMKGGKPDIVVAGNVACSQNPEWLYAQEHNVNFKSYPEVIAEYFVKPNSIVCAGTYGKTSSSALLSWILTHAGFDPSYMFGGLSCNNINSAQMSEDGNWSVLEGDEYKSARWDNRPKFAHYSPTHLLLTSISWDHADIYSTEDAYFRVFQQLLLPIEEKKQIVACKDDPGISKLLQVTRFTFQDVTTYARRDANYTFTNPQQTHQGLSFDIGHKNESYHIVSPMLGSYQAENICGCFAMAHQIGAPVEKIVEAISAFKGLKRRLEKRHEGAVTVIDDIAHSPAKAKSALQTLRQIYKGKIFAVFEPNTGNRRPQSAPSYSHAFDEADEVIIPVLTKLKTDPEDPDKPFDGQDLSKVISATHSNALHIANDQDLITRLATSPQPGDVIVFLGSHGFRGMITELIDKIG